MRHAPPPAHAFSPLPALFARFFFCSSGDVDALKKFFDGGIAVNARNGWQASTSVASAVMRSVVVVVAAVVVVG